ncbi:response regulator [Aquimarina mytili]|uniref:Response regulator transcription factor n=1 Tax=Aquimarina mytili TaxID=874423 RepID=A0A937DB51_9FLAO|nr:response regulator transcription factor [Aquimarina mytili]MBL0683441.1 response regulator transcription factor [Aquimarina mytili]
MIKPKIFLADDHPLILEGNKVFLERNGFSVIGTAKNGNEAFNKISKLQPDIVILDMDMPIISGLEVAKALKAKKIGPKIIILTLFKKVELLKEIGNTIDGYILKEDALDEIINCIQIVTQGKTYASQKLQKGMFYNTMNTKTAKLTPTEKKILSLIDKNLTSAQIAERLFISGRTVEKHRSNIIHKLQLDSGHNALILWLQRNPDALDT